MMDPFFGFDQVNNTFQLLNKKFVIQKKRMANELRNLTFAGRGTDPREVLVEDRTKPHSDHCDGDGIETTAAVGILKAVHCGIP